MSCGLVALKDSAIKEWLPGLLVSDGAVELDLSQFDCCGGLASRWDKASNTTLQCEVRGRLAAVRKLGAQYYSTWGQDGVGLAAAFASPPAEVALRRLQSLAAGTGAKGLAYFTGGAGVKGVKQPTVWALAAAAAWRFGLDAHVVTLDRGKGLVPTPRLPPVAARKSVLFIENAQRLWHTPVAEELERLVSFAYGALMPLWVEFRASPPDLAGATSLNVRTALSKRVADAKRKAPLAWLAPETRSKFLAVADAAPGVAAAPPRRAPPPAAARHLPWDH